MKKCLLFNITIYFLSKLQFKQQETLHAKINKERTNNSNLNEYIKTKPQSLKFYIIFLDLL